MPADLALLLRGLAIGLSIAAPVGPIGVLCIRRTLAGGRLSGLASGLGAATADAIYGSIAGFGLTFVSSFLIQQQLWLRLAGGLFLCYLGARTFVARPAQQPAAIRSRSLLGDYASTLGLTLTNPVTILAFAAIFAGLGLGQTGGRLGAAGLLVLGIFLGSAMWWLTLSTGVGLLRGRITASLLHWINRLAGLVIAGFGLAALLSLFSVISKSG
jgi:threonine/homoserine/homoserine lactone efflux protein